MQINYNDYTNVIKSIQDIDKKVKEEVANGNNEEKYTQLMFEQMLRGLYLNESNII